MDINNPSVAEIRTWAYSNEAWPHIDWDLFLSWTEEIDLFIQLATVHQCPKRLFFLHLLYFMVGATFIQSEETQNLERITLYIDKGQNIKHADIKIWHTHVKALVDGTQTYNFENWRGDKYAGFNFI